MTYSIDEYVPGMIYIVEYPVRFGGLDLFSRMTIVRLNDGKLWLHSPCKLDALLKSQIDQLGEVAYIIAPGNFHHLYVSDLQTEYPNAETFLCPGLEKKRADLSFDWILGNRPDPRWELDFEQIVIQGTRIINEVAFLHKPTGTLILVDLLENIGDDYTHEAGLLLRFWWKAVFHMWNNPKPAPEYQLGWGDKEIVRKGLEKILSWEFERIIIAHGNLIEVDAKAVATKAWVNVLNAQHQDLQINTNGSVDVYFGPETPAGKGSNWVQTIPGKGWFMILRLQGPLEPWFNKTWRPGEIELQPQSSAVQS